jgi:hypothetical protein
MPVATYTASEERTAVREGIVTGMIGAAVVALFFLGVDLIRGVPGLTPSVLGEVFVLRRPSAVTTSVDMTAAALYTAVHVLAFAGFGLLLAALARRSETSSLVRYAVFPVFLAFVIFFQGVLAVADETTRGLFPMWSVLTANLLAAGAMAWYLWRQHPRLRMAYRNAPLGAPSAASE